MSEYVKARVLSWRNAFDPSDMWLGAKECLPVALSVMIYGSVFGMLAAQKGMNLPTVVLMGTTVFAGSAQFVVLDMWNHPLVIPAILLATFIVNLRYSLICASLRELFSKLRVPQKFIGVLFVADENWAITMAAGKRGRGTAGHILGGGLIIYVLWNAGSVLGHQVGSLITSPEKFGMDFSFTAVFIALAVGMWRGKGDLFPWIVAGVAAALSWAWLPGKWYILIGALCGMLVATFANGEESA